MPDRIGPSEHDIQRQILGWLEHKHIFHWRANCGAFAGEYRGKKRFMRFGKKGMPDIFAVHQGKIIGIEVKAANGELSPHQVEFGVELKAAGGIYIVARNLDECVCWFECNRT